MFPSSELLKVSSVAPEGVMTWWRVLIHKENNVKCVSTTESICLAIRKKIFHKKIYPFHPQHVITSGCN